MLAAHGAFAQKVTVEFDQAANFSDYKTFAIREGQLNSKNPALNSPLVKKQIEADIERDLTAKGLTGDRTIRPQRAIHVWRGPQDGSGDLSCRMVRHGHAVREGARTAEGTLVIDFRDPMTRALVWRAIASEEKSDPSKIEGKAQRHGEEVDRKISSEEVIVAAKRTFFQS